MDIERITDMTKSMEAVAGPAGLQKVIPKRLMRSEEGEVETQELAPRRPAGARRIHCEHSEIAERTTRGRISQEL